MMMNTYKLVKTIFNILETNDIIVFKYEAITVDDFNYQETWKNCQYCQKDQRGDCINDDCNAFLSDSEFTDNKLENCICIPDCFYAPDDNVSIELIDDLNKKENLLKILKKIDKECKDFHYTYELDFDEHQKIVTVMWQD